MEILLILLVILMIILIAILLSRRSITSYLCAIGFRVIRYNRRFKEGVFEKTYEKRLLNPEPDFPDEKTINKVDKMVIQSKNVYIMKNNKYDKVIIYLHGGAFFDRISKYHVRFIDRIVSQNQVKVYIPCYDIITKDGCKAAYDFLSEVYDIVQKEGKEIIIMGDSAGGGLGLGFTQYLQTQKKAIPNKLILFSPWVDLTMNNTDVKDYIKKDPVLDLYAMNKINRMWAQDLALNDPLVSPINGKLTDLPNTLIIYGDRGVLYPDLKKLVNKMKDRNNKVSEYVGKGLHHIFPLYPIFKFKKVKEIINNFINS